MTTTVTVTTKRQLVLPKEFCRRAKIRAGAQLRLVELKGGIYLSPIPEPTENELRAVLRAAGGPSAKEPEWASRKVKAAIQAVRAESA